MGFCIMTHLWTSTPSRDRAQAPSCFLPCTLLPRGSYDIDLHHQRLILPVFELYLNRIVQGALLCLASFTQHFVCEIHSCCCVQQSFSLLCTRGQQTVSIKGQIVSIFSYADHTVSFTTTQLHHCDSNAVIDNTHTHTTHQATGWPVGHSLPSLAV